MLVIPPAPTTTAVLLAEAARRRGMEVREPARRPVPAEWRGRAHLYGGEAFADEVAAALGIALLDPSPGWLAGLPAEFTRRDVRLTTLEDAYGLDRPAFVKPAAGKAFPARVHASGGALPRDVPAATPVLVAEPVTFAEEYRLHVLDGTVRAASRYRSHGILDPAPLAGLPERARIEGFAADLLRHAAAALPSAAVVDVGMVAGRPAVVEANEAWFSNCYAADPDRVLDVVLRAAGPAALLASRDVPFLRAGGRKVAALRVQPPAQGPAEERHQHVGEHRDE